MAIECTVFNDGLEVGTFNTPTWPVVGEYCPVIEGTVLAVYSIDTELCTCSVDIEW